MLHIAICDDEKDFVQYLTDLLNQYSKETGRDIKITPYYDGMELIEKYDTTIGELVGDAGNAALTPQSKLQGHKENGADDYTGSYEATYSEFAGTEILFGGTTLEREAGNMIHITCSLSLESGEAAVFLRSGADDPVILLSESGEYDGTIEVDGTSTYIGVWGDQAEGTVSIEIE